MSHDPSGIRLNYSDFVEKVGGEESGGYSTDDEAAERESEEKHHTEPSWIPLDTVRDPSGISLQYGHKVEAGCEGKGGGRVLEPTLIRLPPVETDERHDVSFFDTQSNDKPVADTDLSREADHDKSPKTGLWSLQEPVDRLQFPLTDSPAHGHFSKYKMEMNSCISRNGTTPPSEVGADSLGDAWASNITPTRPGAQLVSSKSARIKNGSMEQADKGTKPSLSPNFVHSEGMPAQFPKHVQAKSPRVLLQAPNTAAAAAITRGPDDNEDFIQANASVRFRDKMNAKMKSVPEGAHDSFGPAFKDQARGFNPLDNNKINDGESQEKDIRGPTFRHQTGEAEEEESSTAGDDDGTTMMAERSQDGLFNRGTRLVEAELVNPAEAEVVEEKPQRKAWIIILALLVIGAILGGILGSRKDGDRDSISETEQNPGCNNATALELDGAAIAVQLFTKPSFMVDPLTLQKCGTETMPTDEHNGLWFTFETNMTRGVRISTCTDSDIDDNLGIQVLVFSGPCDQLQCVQATRNNNGAAAVQGCGTGAWVSFQALQATSLYHILVYGNKVSNYPEANFTLQAANIPVKPANNKCEDATPLEADGQWQNASVLDAYIREFDCYYGYYFEGPAVWFVLEPRQGEITISTCSPANSFGYSIVLFSGSCSQRECLSAAPAVPTNDELLGCNGIVTSAQFFTNGPGTYQIMVQSNLVNTADFTPGDGHEDFSIVARSTMLEPTGCDGAIELELGKTVSFKSVGDTSDTMASCSISKPSSSIGNGVWFQVIGNNTTYTATTCTEYSFNHSEYGGQIFVYSGRDCHSLSCIAFNNADNAAPCNAGTSWLAENAVPYWIRVFGFPSNIATFSIVVIPTPPNQECDGAIVLEAGQGTVNGTTLGALARSRGDFCGDADGFSEGFPAVWYSVTGTDEDLTVLTCTGNWPEQLLLSSQILVYDGTCNDLTCINRNNFLGLTDYESNSLTSCTGGVDAVVSWFAKAGMVYYIKVIGFFNTAGPFELGLQVGKPTDPPTSTPTTR